MEPEISDVVRKEFTAYLERRRRYYTEREALLHQILQKDPLIFALRGARDAREFIEQALSAHESSSEETMMGHVWQAVLAESSPNSVGGGDLRTERDGTLWIIQVKMSPLQNSSAEAQDLRLLRTKLLQERDHHPGRRNVKTMLGIIRGQSKDEWRVYRAKGQANADIDGFQYQYKSGGSFRRWFNAEFTSSSVLAGIQGGVQAVRQAREDAIEELSGTLRAKLRSAGLRDSIADLLLLLDRA